MRTTAWALSVAALALLAAPSGGALLGQDTVSIPIPVTGDAGLYAVEHRTAHATSAYENAFEVRDPRIVQDAYGREHPAHMLREHILDGDGVAGSRSSAWAGHDGGPLNTSTGYEAGFTAGSEGTMGGSVSVGAVGARTSFNHDDHDPTPGACGLIAGLQGETLHEDEPAPDAVCGTSLTDRPPGDPLDVSVRVVDVTEHEAGTVAHVVLEARAPEVDATVDAWFRDDIPYPLEVDVHAERAADVPWAAVYERHPDLERVDAWALGLLPASDAEGEAVHRAEATLERFQRGDGAAVPPGGLEPWPDRNPAMAFEPVDRWGPASGQTPFDYPIEEAARSIEEDPTLVELQGWMSEHPDFRAGLAEHTTQVQNGQRTETWRFILVAPDESAWWVTSERPTGAGPDGSLVEASPPASDNDAQRVSDLNVSYPPAADVSPTIASAVETWEERKEDERELSLVRFHRQPGHVQLRVGYMSQQGGMDPEDPMAFEVGANTTTLAIDPEDGALLTHETATYVVGTPSGPLKAGQTGFTAPSTPPAGATAPQVATGAAVTGALALLLLLAAKLGALPFYSRLSRDELLEHEARRRVYEAIDEDPGTALATVAERADVTRSTARYHLRRLEEAGLVQSVKSPDARRFFPAGYEAEEMQREALLETGRTREVYEAIREDPGASLQEVSQRADIAASSAHRIVERLEEAGLVERGRSGRSVELRATD